MSAVKQIYIGTDNARILRISEERIDYQDEKGLEGSVDLNLCHQLLKEHFKSDRKYIGFRNAARNNPYATLSDGAKVRFIFASYEAIYAELLDPLREVGWNTMDLD